MFDCGSKRQKYKEWGIRVWEIKVYNQNHPKIALVTDNLWLTSTFSFLKSNSKQQTQALFFPRLSTEHLILLLEILMYHFSLNTYPLFLWTWKFFTLIQGFSRKTSWKNRSLVEAFFLFLYAPEEICSGETELTKRLWINVSPECKQKKFFNRTESC